MPATSSMSAESRESSPAPVLAASAALRAALADFDPKLLLGSDCARVAEDLAATEKACHSIRLLTAARAVDSGAHRSAGFRDGAAWLARQSGMTSHQAKRELETADRLDDCPDTRQALVSGQISMAQATEITQAEADSPGAERTLLPVARSSDLTTVRDQARRERLARTPVDELHSEQRRARYFRHWRDRLGMVCIAGALPPDVGVPLVNRLDHAAARACRAAREASPESGLEKWEAYAADALVELCAGPAQSRRSDNAELVIVCDLNAWRRGHAHPSETCHIIGGGPIPVEVAKELTKDAFLKAVLHDGVAINTVKHFGRYYPAELRTALDLGPVPEFSGRQCAQCGSRWGLEYDHINPVGNRGPTSYANVQALCWADHQAKTESDRQAGLIRGRPPKSDGPPDDP